MRKHRRPFLTSGQVNIFRWYEQQENRFTNALMAILSVSRLADDRFLAEFLKSLSEY